MNTQSAYQRWELASLNGDLENDFRTMPPAIARLAQQMMDAKDEAVHQGYTEGYTEGNSKGLNEGFASGQNQALEEGRLKQAEIAARLNNLIDLFVNDLKQAREQIAEDLLRLSLDMAQAIVKQSLIIDQSLILPIIEQALLDIPSLTLPATIHLHPDDATLVENAMGITLKSQGWRLVADSSIEKGGCSFNTPSQDIDLRLSTRWEKLWQQMGLTPSASDP